jgi:hypothetical protein
MLASVYLVARFVSRLIPAVMGIRHPGIPRQTTLGKNGSNSPSRAAMRTSEKVKATER